MKRIGWCVAAAWSLVLGCSHAKQDVKAESPAAAAAPDTVASAERAADPAAHSKCMTDDQCKANELCISSKCVSITAELGECRKTSTHFEFDSAVLRKDDLPRLQRAARCMGALPAVGTLVAGNCDERGTVQYNIALGFRRAHSVAKYLQDLGVAPARLSEVSYGEEIPGCTELTEECWATNRRADIARGEKARDVSARIRVDEERERQALGGEADGAPAAEQPATQAD